ncbi:MAG: tryptophan synthase subunit alpha [Candidatus Eisenbacteria bacterium]
MSRLGAAFAARSGSTGLIPFVTAGYPDLDSTLDMLRGFARAGALAVEIGIPFSDPIADGPDIQRASEWALRAGVSVADVFDLVARFRRESDLPVVLMTYANPVVWIGADDFALRASQVGVDGIILSDLPPEESPEVWAALERERIETILLVAPTTESARIPVLLGRCRGFVYCLSRTGVTGQAGGYGGALPERIAELRPHTKLPIAVGFGISTGDDARRLRKLADAVIVGAAFMRRVTLDPAKGATARVVALAEELTGALGP